MKQFDELLKHIVEKQMPSLTVFKTATGLAIYSGNIWILEVYNDQDNIELIKRNGFVDKINIYNHTFVRDFIAFIEQQVVATTRLYKL